MLNLIYGLPNVSFFDSYWVAVHFSAGLLTGLGVLTYYHTRRINVSSRIYAWTGLGLLVLWEYFEVFLRYVDRYGDMSRATFKVIIPDTFFEIESLTNIMSDLILGSIGLYLIYQYRARGNGTINR